LAHEARAVVDMTADDLTAESSRDRVRHRLRYSLGPERTIVKVRGLRANRSNEHRIGWLCAARLAVLVTAVAAFGCGRAEQAEKPFEGPSEEWRGQIAPSDLNIVLVTIDTLRTDRVSSYGSDLVDTPNIDGFASEGVLFSNAASTVPFTLPAHSSILTGLYPPGHGVRENVGYTLHGSIPTLAEVLSEGGWNTAGFVSAFVLDGRWGIDQGFDYYFDDFDLADFDTPNLGSVQRSGDVTIAEAVRWLDGRARDDPFFLWLHLYDPHDPYTPPEPFKSQYPGRPYDGEVAYTDSLIGEFRRALEDRDLLSSSLVILTADHGEGLGDHGEGQHGFFVYDSTIHVSLIVRPPSAVGGGRVVDAAVSHVDIFPTVLDAAGLSAPKRVHGQSLLAMIAGENVELDRGVYSESLYPLLHYGWAPLRAIRTDNSKLISAPRPEVFDIIADPRETHDLSLEEPVVTGELENRLAELRKLIESDAPAAGAAPDLDAETLAQLQALGYAAGQGGVGLEEETDRPRADPKDKIGVHRTIMRAQSLMKDDEEAAEKTLLAVLETDPDVLDAHQMLGHLASTQKRFEDALEYFRRALELDPSHKNSLMGMASSYRALGSREEALVGFRRVLEVSGPDTRASLAIADIEINLGHYDEAARALSDAAKTTEVPGLIHNKLGEVRAEQGRSSEAMALFAEAIAETEDFAVPYFNIAVLYEERGEAEPAIANYEKTIELAPKYYEAQFNLGRLLGHLGQVDRQQELWEASLESNPTFVQGYYYLSKLLMDRGGDLGRAEELVRLGIENDPDHEGGPVGYYVLADILNRTGRAAEARDAVATGQRIQAEMEF
jgi:arylsulfatase A-like enzyme/Tfp pilus assembly protein PilF